MEKEMDQLQGGEDMLVERNTKEFIMNQIIGLTLKERIKIIKKLWLMTIRMLFVNYTSHYYDKEATNLYALANQVRLALTPSREAFKQEIDKLPFEPFGVNLTNTVKSPDGKEYDGDTNKLSNNFTAFCSCIVSGDYKEDCPVHGEAVQAANLAFKQKESWEEQ